LGGTKEFTEKGKEVCSEGSRFVQTGRKKVVWRVMARMGAGKPLSPALDIGHEGRMFLYRKKKSRFKKGRGFVEGEKKKGSKETGTRQ